MDKRIVIGGDAARAQSVIAFECLAKKYEHGVFGERGQFKDLRARVKRAVNEEQRVMGGCADKRDGAFLDMGQEHILLRLRETMNLIDEQNSLGAFVLSAMGCGPDKGAQCFNVRHDAACSFEPAAGGCGYDFGQGRFSATGRTVEDNAAEKIGFNCASEESAGAENMVLSDDAVDSPRTHARGQRFGVRLLPGTISLEQVHHSASRQKNTPPSVAEACSLFQKQQVGALESDHPILQ